MRQHFTRTGAPRCDDDAHQQMQARVARLREAIATDRCDGDSGYAEGVNAACARHLQMFDAIMGRSDVHSECGGFMPGADPSRCLHCGAKVDVHHQGGENG